MQYNIYFDISAVFIYAIVIAFHFQKKNLPLLQNRLYINFLFVALGATLFDIFNTFVRMGTLEAIGIHVSVPVYWVTLTLGYATTNLLPLVYGLYCLVLSDFIDKKVGKKRTHFLIRFIIPSVITVIYIFIAPLLYYLPGMELGSKLACFYISTDGVYYRGGGYYLLFVNTIYYVSFIVIFVSFFCHSLKRQKVFTMLSYIFIMIVAVVIQMLFPKYIVQCFGISLAAVMFAYYIQTPDEYLDRTTDLFNEAALTRMTTHDFAKEESGLCISIILDDVAFISNAFGIEQMNKFLKSVADYLNKEFPNAHHYYIPQGKFCLVFKDYNLRDLERYVFEIRARFQEAWNCNTLSLKLYSRVCVIEYPKDAKSPEELLDIISMISEDERFRRSTIYAKEIDTSLKKRSAYIAHLLRNALAEKRFEVYYQPIYSTKKACLIGAEALIRMRDDNLDFVSPEEFIPISEKTGDILRIGQFVFESVCQTLASIDPDEYGIEKIDINLSVAQCMQDLLADQIMTISTIHNIPPSIINLEITETAAAHTPEILLKNMQRLAREGIELSLDDYGSGYSNMNYLLNLPFKMVKIDKYIVWSAFADSKANVALAATISMIKKLGMTVLAEGVETREHVDWLTSLGCDFLQGFYFSKAIPKDDYLKLMSTERKRVEKENLSKNIYLRELENNQTLEEVSDDELSEI